MTRKSSLSELDPTSSFGPSQRRPRISFNRKELATILTTYGRGVASGQWRDYAIDHLKEAAIFSIFRRSSEMPLYRIEKRPKLAKRQGAYCIVTASGLIIKRGHELAQVLHILNKKTLTLVD